MDIPYTTLPPRKKPVRKVRAKARPGRLKGKAMEQLRRECFERDGYRCRGVVATYTRVLGVLWPKYCDKAVTWETGHMAHIGAKRRHGDSLENVRTLCAECHHIEHSYGKSGVKPCPKKPSDSTRIEG
jgi:5-methylcytosine-specific restriction endonuclease McrA